MVINMKGFLNIPNSYVTIRPEHEYTFIRANIKDMTLRVMKKLGRGVFMKNKNALEYRTYGNVIILLDWRY